MAAEKREYKMIWTMDLNNTSYMEVEEEPLHKEVFKNEAVRIYRTLLEPGKSTKLHRHTENTLYIVLKGGRIRTEKLKASPSCPTYTVEKIPLIKKLKLLREKIFSPYMNLPEGFMFYMPSKKHPVIHRAETSADNKQNMVLLGIEICPHPET